MLIPKPELDCNIPKTIGKRNTKQGENNPKIFLWGIRPRIPPKGGYSFRDIKTYPTPVTI